MQHLAEIVRSFETVVEAFAEARAARTVDGDDVFDDGVDPWAEMGAFRHGGDADGAFVAEEAQDVFEEDLQAEPEEEAAHGHCQQPDGRVGEDGADDEFEHYEEPGRAEVPVEPVEVHAARAEHPTRAAFFPEPPEADEVFADADATEAASANAEDGVGRERGAVPEAKVEPDGHGDAVEADEAPEEGDGEFARVQCIVEGRGAVEETGVAVVSAGPVGEVEDGGEGRAVRGVVCCRLVGGFGGGWCVFLQFRWIFGGGLVFEVRSGMGLAGV